MRQQQFFTYKGEINIVSDQRPNSEFTDVDRADMPEGYVQLLDVQQSMAFVQQYKQRARTFRGQ